MMKGGKMATNMKIDNTILETERLVLRRWKKSDLDDFFEYASVEGVGEMAGWPHHESKDVTLKTLNDFINEDVVAIIYKKNNKVVGSIGLKKSWASSEKKYEYLICKDIGYVLSKDYWGNGLMPEAVNAIVSYCFDELEIDVLTCNHFSFNSQSKKVIDKCGFKYVKSDILYSSLLERNFDTLQYILVSDKVNLYNMST